MLHRLLLTLCLLCLAPTLLATDPPSDTTKPPVFEPANTRVLILPVISSIADKPTLELIDKTKALGEARTAIEKQFSGRGFQIITPEEANRGLVAGKFAPSDQTYAKEAMAAAGKEVRAALVIGAVVEDFSFPSLKCMCILRTKVLEAASESYLVNGVFMGRREAPLRAAFSKGPKLETVRDTIKQAVEQSFKDLLKPYKKTKPAKQSPPAQTPSPSGDSIS